MVGVMSNLGEITVLEGLDSEYPNLNCIIKDEKNGEIIDFEMIDFNCLIILSENGNISCWNYDHSSSNIIGSELVTVSKDEILQGIKVVSIEENIVRLAVISLKPIPQIMKMGA